MKDSPPRARRATHSAHAHYILPGQYLEKNVEHRGWSLDGSEVKTTCCSCRGPRFSSQHPHGGSKPSVTPVLQNLVPSSDLFKHQAGSWCIYTHVGIHIVNKHF